MIVWTIRDTKTGRTWPGAFATERAARIYVNHFAEKVIDIKIDCCSIMDEKVVGEVIAFVDADRRATCS